MEASDATATKIKEVLYICEIAYGQQINYQKSAILFEKDMETTQE